MKRLKDKVAVVYGDGNGGSTIAKAFAREGGRVYLTGRTGIKLADIANETLHGEVGIETDVLDKLNNRAVNLLMRETAKKEGKVDISFNAIGIPQKRIHGIPLTELSVENFSFPMTTIN